MWQTKFDLLQAQRQWRQYQEFVKQQAILEELREVTEKLNELYRKIDRFQQQSHTVMESRRRSMIPITNYGNGDLCSLYSQSNPHHPLVSPSALASPNTSWNAPTTECKDQVYYVPSGFADPYLPDINGPPDDSQDSMKYTSHPPRPEPLTSPSEAITSDLDDLETDEEDAEDGVGGSFNTAFAIMTLGMKTWA
ncbi:hypothetical protein B0H14DRAFT_2611739 [Mycena olivaceomarginata]|nr:hypothetical protein B0H14DRAFT_2611739 [Mycena olivaceomarginata]